MEKDSFIVAVPSKWPGGVDSQPALGLTTCDCFSLFAIENGGIHHTIVLPNPPDRYSGCGRRIDILHSFGTNKVLLKNAGKRALLKLDKCGIKSLNCEQGSVRHAVEKCLKGTLEATRISGACHKLPEGAVPEDCRFNELSLDSPCQCPYGMCGERSVLRTED
jgi:predicted Fe-Mo cluster-binding NifX family protein